MSRILSPNPLVITITVNEVTGEIKTVSTWPIAHIDAVDILLRVMRGYLDDGKAQAVAMEKRLQNPGNNPGGNPDGGANGS